MNFSNNDLKQKSLTIHQVSTIVLESEKLLYFSQELLLFQISWHRSEVKREGERTQASRYPKTLFCFLEQKCLKVVRDVAEDHYQVFFRSFSKRKSSFLVFCKIFRRTGQRPKLSISKLRILIAQALGAAWKEMLQNPKIIIRSFEKVGLSLPLDGSQDKDKMHFQGCETGIPDGMQFSSSS